MENEIKTQLLALQGNWSVFQRCLTDFSSTRVYELDYDNGKHRTDYSQK